VRILSINHTTNVITLAAPRTWSTGAGVHLAYTGSAPDIGAYEFVSGPPSVQSPIRPMPPEFVSPANGATVIATRVRVTWMNAAGAESYVVQLAKDSLFTRMLFDSEVTDITVEIGPLDSATRYYRRIRARSPAGESEFGPVSSFTTGAFKGQGSILDEGPTTFALGQNYPNPFNPTTAVRYSVPQPTRVSLRVYNLLGAEVAVLEDSERAIGVYEVRFDASAFPSGVYFYRLEAGDFHETKRMTLIR
jgi:hypothetical protein